MEETFTPVDPTKLEPGTQIEVRFRGRVSAGSSPLGCYIQTEDGSTWAYLPKTAKVYLVTPATTTERET